MRVWGAGILKLGFVSVRSEPINQSAVSVFVHSYNHALFYMKYCRDLPGISTLSFVWEIRFFLPVELSRLVLYFSAKAMIKARNDMDVI